MSCRSSNRLPFLLCCRSRSAALTLAALGCLLLMPVTALLSAEVSQSWKTRWEQTVEAAKKEGQITVYGSVDGENEAIKLAEEALSASKKK
jgi:hypothetical protein